MLSQRDCETGQQVVAEDKGVMIWESPPLIRVSRLLESIRRLVLSGIYMGKSSKKDFISGLPQSIIEIILTKLPIRDAVRTSILAKKWRYQWATMTQLVFDSECMSLSDDTQVAQKELANFIARFLLLHEGPIHKFNLSTCQLIRFDDLDQWLLFLSRKDIKRLVLKMFRCPLHCFYSIPSCIFSCQKLIKLKLLRFEVKPPSGFQGFPCLKYLSLNICEVTVEVIENLISNCPLLEEFDLDTMSAYALTVHASKLKHLTLYGSFKDVYLEHTPLLVTALISFSQDWEGNVLSKVPATYDCLESISLKGLNFQEMNQVLFVHQLLLQSPNLQELEIDARAVGLVHHKAGDLDFWKRECPADFTFKHLKEVMMSDVSNKYDVKFLEFVLERSPVLGEMLIFPDEGYNNEDNNEKMNMADKVLHCVRASPEVDVIICD
ncbi:hypothetical protein AgCh_020195 [Apium graveolens]